MSKIVTATYFFVNAPGWTNESYIKPSIDTYNSFMEMLDEYKEHYDAETNPTPLPDKLMRSTDFVVNWESYKQGTLTVGFAQEQLPRYMVVVEEKIVDNKIFARTSTFKHYFLEPIKTKNRNKTYVTFAVTPDVWVEEVLVKGLSIFAKKQLTSKVDEVFKNDSIVKDNLIYESPANYIKEPEPNLTSIPEDCRHIGAPGAFSIFATNYKNHSLPQVDLTNNNDVDKMSFYGGWYTVSFLLGERNINNFTYTSVDGTKQTETLPEQIHTLNRLVENPFNNTKLNGVDANWYIIDYQGQTDLKVEPTQFYNGYKYNKKDWDKTPYSERFKKFFGTSGTTMSSFYEKGTLAEGWQQNWFLSSGTVGTTSYNWMEIQGKDKLDKYFKVLGNDYWSTDKMHFGFVWTQNNNSTTIGNDLVAKYFYKPEIINDVNHQLSINRSKRVNPFLNIVYNNYLPTFTKNIGFNFYNSYDNKGYFEWNSPFEELRLGINQITSTNPGETVSVDASDFSMSGGTFTYDGNPLAPGSLMTNWTVIYTKLPFKFTSLKRDGETNNYTVHLEKGESIKSDYWWIINYNGKLYYAIKLNPTYLDTNLEKPEQFKPYNPNINQFIINVDAFNGYSLLLKNGQEIALSYGKNVVKTLYITQTKSGDNDISNGWINGSQLIIDITNEYGTKTYFAEFNKDIAGSDLEKQLQFLQIQNEGRNVQDRLTFQKYERDKGLANAAISTVTGAGMIASGAFMGIGSQPQYAPAILSGIQNMTNGINNLVYGSVTRTLQHQIEQRDAANAKQKLFLQMQQLNLNTANLDMWSAKMLFVNDLTDFGFLILHYTPTKPSLELYYNLANNYGVDYDVTQDIGLFNPAEKGVHEYQFIKPFTTSYWDELTTIFTAPYRVI